MKHLVTSILAISITSCGVSAVTNPHTNNSGSERSDKTKQLREEEVITAPASRVVMEYQIAPKLRRQTPVFENGRTQLEVQLLHKVDDCDYWLSTRVDNGEGKLYTNFDFRQVSFPADDLKGNKIFFEKDGETTPLGEFSSGDYVWQQICEGEYASSCYLKVEVDPSFNEDEAEACEILDIPATLKIEIL